MQLGNFEITLIKDVTMHMDGGGAFGLVPRKLWSRHITPDENNLIPMAQTCLLVRAHGKNILIDTGLGAKLDDRQRRFWSVENEGGLLRGLATVGLQPEDIDVVINTHLHTDHCGGNTRWRSADDHSLVSTFPNAEHVVQRREYEDAMCPNERTSATYMVMNYEPLMAQGQLRLLDGDTEILPGIHGLITPGHTPAHMSIHLESEGQHVLYVCDLASFAVHFEKLGWMSAFDVEPLITLETKRRMQQWVLERDATLIFVHDTLRPVGKLRRTENGVALEKLPETWLSEA